jgi:hypothetical protein
LKPDERRWLLISGITLSEWYINRLVADHKWRYYYAERLDILPADFGVQMEKVMVLNALNEEELRRRRDAFMVMWRQMLPLVEKDVLMKYEEFKNTV